MKFVSLFTPVYLTHDPITGNEGDVYFNTASSTLRVKSQGIWVSLLDENNYSFHTGNIIKTIGDDSTESFSVFFDESFDNSTVFAKAASASQFILGHHEDYPVRTGSQITVIRAGEGSISFVPETASVIFYAPSNIYLTKQWDSVTITNIAEDAWVLQGEFRDLY
jgi:hypothetical protein